MTKGLLKIWQPFVKVLLILTLLLGGYYFFFLKPKLELPSALLKAEKVLSQYHNNLLQNKIAYTGLIKLDPNSVNARFEKSYLVGTLQKTTKEGIEELEQEIKIPNIDPELTKRFPGLLEETKEIYKKEEELLKKVFETKSYEEGVAIMKSSEAVELLTKETNLILEYKFWLERIKKLRSSN